MTGTYPGSSSGPPAPGTPAGVPPPWGPGPAAPPGAAYGRDWPAPNDLASSAVADVRDGIALYRWAAGLGALIAVVAVVAALLNPQLSDLATISSGAGLSASAETGSISGALEGYVVLIDLLEFVAFVLALVAFTRWRAGVKFLRRELDSYSISSASSRAIDRVETGYRRSMWTMLLWVLTALAGGVAVAATVLANVQPTVDQNGTIVAPTSAQIGHAVAAAIGLSIGVAVVLLLVQLLLAYFVLESLDGFVARAGRALPAAWSGSPRPLVYLGLLLNLTGFLNLLYPGAGAVAIAGPLLILLGCQRYLALLGNREKPGLGTPGAF